MYKAYRFGTGVDGLNSALAEIPDTEKIISVTHPNEYSTIIIVEVEESWNIWIGGA